MDYLYGTMTQVAALELRKAILRGTYSPGSRLIPANLEKDLRLSRTAIREAIRELVGTGLAESNMFKGAYVAHPLGMEEIRDAFDTRYQLEGKAAYLGTKNILAEDIGRMEVLLEEMSKRPADGRYFIFMLNQQFHEILYRASGWKYLIKVIEHLLDQVLLFRSSLYRHFDVKTLDEILSWENFIKYQEDHVQIVDAIKSRDPLRAREAVTTNLRRGLEGLEQIVAVVEEKNCVHREDKAAIHG